MTDLSWSDLNITEEKRLLRQRIAQIEAIQQGNLRVRPSTHDNQVISHEDLEIGRIYRIHNSSRKEVVVCISRPWRNEHGSWVVAMVDYFDNTLAEVRNLVDLGLIPDKYDKWTANWIQTTKDKISDEEVVKLRAAIKWPVMTFGPFQME